MSRGLRLGGRVFVPSAGFTVVALVLCALCVRLGAWQRHKGMQREQEWTRFARGADQVIALRARAVSDVPLFQRASVTGRLQHAAPSHRDNRTYGRRARSEVLAPLARPGGALGAPLAACIMLLDPQAPFGYVREWQPPGLGPLRHLAYAIQWWSFAMLALIVWAILSTRRNPAAPTR